MSELGHTFAGMHHPWRAFRALTDWKLLWSDLPEGLLGFTDFRRQTVTLTTGMTQAERRCTIAHETQHILRGMPLCERQEELVIDRQVGRLLLPQIKPVADAMIWHQGDYEPAAEDLWVDETILRARFQTMHPVEMHYVRRRYSEL